MAATNQCSSIRSFVQSYIFCSLSTSHFIVIILVLLFCRCRCSIAMQWVIYFFWFFFFLSLFATYTCVRSNYTTLRFIELYRRGYCIYFLFNSLLVVFFFVSIQCCRSMHYCSSALYLLNKILWNVHLKRSIFILHFTRFFIPWKKIPFISISLIQHPSRRSFVVCEMMENGKKYSRNWRWT